jgi:hypothetical protein
MEVDGGASPRSRLLVMSPARHVDTQDAEPRGVPGVAWDDKGETPPGWTKGVTWLLSWFCAGRAHVNSYGALMSDIVGVIRGRELPPVSDAT